MAHTVYAKVEYTTMTFVPPFSWNTVTTTVDQTITVDIENLIVTATQPNNPNPILWNPNPMQSVEADATVGAAYRRVQPIKLSIYTADQVLVKTYQQWLP